MHESEANVYIDIGYIVAGLVRTHNLDPLRLNLADLAGHGASLFGFSLRRTYLYNGVASAEEPPSWKEQREWMERNNRERNCHFRRGRVASALKEQKRVDVQLTVDVLRDVRNSGIENIVLVTGDDDFVPLIEAVCELGPYVGLLLIPKHGSTRDLEDAADAVHWIDFGSSGWQHAFKAEKFV